MAPNNFPLQQLNAFAAIPSSAGKLVQAVNKPIVSLKANVDAQKRSAGNPYLAHQAIGRHRPGAKPESTPSADDASYVDPKAVKKAAAARPKRAGFSFVAEGTYAKEADKMREKELLKEHKRLLRGNIAAADAKAEADKQAVRAT